MAIGNRVSVNIPIPLAQRLDRIVKKTGLWKSRDEIIRTALLQWVEDQEAKVVA